MSVAWEQAQGKQEGEDKAPGPAGGWEVPLGAPPPCCGSPSALAHGGESQTPAWVSLDLPYGVGYICGKAVRNIPHSFSLFSPIHIYPTVSSPHTKTDLNPATTAQRVNCGPTEQLGWEHPYWK